MAASTCLFEGLPSSHWPQDGRKPLQHLFVHSRVTTRVSQTPAITMMTWSWSKPSLYSQRSSSCWSLQNASCRWYFVTYSERTILVHLPIHSTRINISRLFFLSHSLFSSFVSSSFVFYGLAYLSFCSTLWKIFFFLFFVPCSFSLASISSVSFLLGTSIMRPAAKRAKA